MWKVPGQRGPQELGGESTNVSNGATYRGDLRREKSERRGLLLRKIVMVSGITAGLAIAGFLLWDNAHQEPHMRLVDWLIIACVTLFATMNCLDYFLWNQRKRGELFVYGTLTFIFGNLFVTEDKPWAAAYCITLAIGQLVLVWNLRKKSETR